MEKRCEDVRYQESVGPAIAPYAGMEVWDVKLSMGHVIVGRVECGPSTGFHCGHCGWHGTPHQDWSCQCGNLFINHDVLEMPPVQELEIKRDEARSALVAEFWPSWPITTTSCAFCKHRIPPGARWRKHHHDCPYVRDDQKRAAPQRPGSKTHVDVRTSKK